MNWIQLLLGLAPTILAAAKVPAALIPTVTHAIGEAQQLPGASGAEKKAHVLSIVQDGVETFNAAKGKTVIDPALAVAATSGGIDTTIATINLVKGKHEPATV
jgi:hypothetical protein